MELARCGEAMEARKRTFHDPLTRGAEQTACGRVFGLSGLVAALPLRDSAGFAPDFPRFFQLGHRPSGRKHHILR